MAKRSGQKNNGNADKKSIRVRMYRVGFGDCFLLSLPVGRGSEAEYAHFVIDCGVHSSGHIGTIHRVVENIAEVTGGKIAAVIATHSHQDHISGFSERFSDFQIGEVWLPWSEDPKDALAAKWNKKQNELVKRLETHFSAQAALNAAEAYTDARRKALSALANLSGEVVSLDGSERPRLSSNKKAMDRLRSGFGGGAQVRYLEAGDALNDACGVTGLAVKVLSPPRDKEFLAKMDPPEDQRYLRLDGGLKREDNKLQPFPQKWIAETRSLSTDEELKLKALLVDNALDGLAFALDSAKNNTSLVTLFIYQGQYLLFPGDAQYGNWKYWLDKEADDILPEINFLKVAHHGSHNAMPASALEKMTTDNFAAMVSTQSTPWDSIPRVPLMRRLDEQTAQKIVRSDWIKLEGAPEPLPDSAPQPPENDPKGFSKGEFWYDYELNDAVLGVNPGNDDDALYFENESSSSRREHIYGNDRYSNLTQQTDNAGGSEMPVKIGSNNRFELLDENAELHTTAQSPEYKQISAWVSELENTPDKPLAVNQAYTLNLKVGAQQAANLIVAESAKISSSDIPNEGLDTDWVINTKNVRLDSITATADESIGKSKINGSDAWTARFSLHIPKSEDSLVKQVRITPLGSENAELQIIIFAKGKMYRKFTVELNVEDEEKKTAEPAAKITDEVIFSPANELNIPPTQEWLTPPGSLKIIVLKGDAGAYVSGEVVTENGDIGTVGTLTEWPARKEIVNPLIKNLRECAKNLCNNWDVYLNNITSDELIARLTAAAEETSKYGHSFAYAGNADASHLSGWTEEVAPSEELRRLASFGYLLFDTIFPADSDLRGWLDSLSSGWRIDISWSDSSGSAYVPNIPWGMLYTVEPKRDQPIEASRFFGLRYRLDYTAYDIKKPKSRALGSDPDTYKAGCFYWGNQPNDVVAIESTWQQNQWKNWANQNFIPGSNSQDQMSLLLSFLQKPAPSPLRFLYFYCHCRVDDDTVFLRFGKGNQTSDLVDQLGLGLSPIADQPIVFVNACSSASGDAYGVNQLIETFMRRRDCRAFIGTEIDMPVVLASRFALVFSYFFFRRITTRKITAGEAFYQAKLFLWHHYRNIGGIFYTYINEYDLMMASSDEL